tara:strand:- start:122 stop:1774 length:1653 start_codon:yes stop_codon:yes gene_type:complete
MYTELKNLPLPKVDSKFKKLREVISGIFDENQHIADNKVMIFCTFRATIRYLKDKLQKDFPDAYVGTISGEDDIDARDEKRKRFVENTKKTVLICSEVAGEGLDFQSCHYLVNYDMPWNPAKLEQRVGRIDRIGQKAEIIKIFNLVNKYTIEDHIVAKLFERVKLFNSTIGPLAELLGRYQKDFTNKLLRTQRTAAEKEAYERVILANISDRKKEQEAFEERQLESFGTMDYFYDEKCKKNTYFKENEIKFTWEYFIDEYIKLHQIEIKTSFGNNICSIHVDSNVGDMFLELTRVGLSRQFNKKKKEEYERKIHMLKEKNKPIRLTFNHRCALDNLSIEYLNITHPFVQGALQFLKGTYRQNKKLLICHANTKKIPNGNYIMLIYRFYIINCKDVEREVVEERYYIYDLNKSSGNWDEGEDVFNDIIVEGPGQGPESNIKYNIEEIEDVLKKDKCEMAQTILNEYRHIYNNKIGLQKLAIANYYTSQIMSIKNNLQFIHDPFTRDENLKEIDRLEEQKRHKIEQLEKTDLRIDIKCTGIIYIVNKEMVYG